jgi:hypothetical protein
MLPSSVGSYTTVLLMVLLIVLVAPLGVLTVTLKLVVELIVATLEFAELVGLQAVAEQETSTVLVAMLDLVVERVLDNYEGTVVELGSVSGLLR